MNTPVFPRRLRRLAALGLVCTAATFAAAPAAPPAGPEKPCCPAPDTPAAAARELPPGDYTRGSLYQLDARFTDDAGQPFALGALRGRPVVLTLFFASCSYACPLLVGDMARIRDGLPPALRDRAALVLVSFDTVRDTPAALARFRTERSLGPQWTLLHGADDAVRELAALLGVKFKPETGGQFAHSNLITILNPEGEIVHQRAGLKGGLEAAGQALAGTLAP
jgi:protein SCO1/2